MLQRKTGMRVPDGQVSYWLETPGKGGGQVPPAISSLYPAGMWVESDNQLSPGSSRNMSFPVGGEFRAFANAPSGPGGGPGTSEGPSKDSSYHGVSFSLFIPSISQTPLRGARREAGSSIPWYLGVLGPVAAWEGTPS